MPVCFHMRDASNVKLKVFYRVIAAFYRPASRWMFMNPSDKLGLHRAVVTLLSGRVEHGFMLRLKLETFYLLGRLLSLLPANRRFSESCSHGCSVHRPGAAA